MLATSTSPGFLKFLFENIDWWEEKRESLSGILWILLINFGAIIYFLFLLCPVIWVLSHPLALDLNCVLLIYAFCCSCSMLCRVGIKTIGVTETKPDNKNTGGEKKKTLIFSAVVLWRWYMKVKCSHMFWLNDWQIIFKKIIIEEASGKFHILVRRKAIQKHWVSFMPDSLVFKHLKVKKVGQTVWSKGICLFQSCLTVRVL